MRQQGNTLFLILEMAEKSMQAGTELTKHSKMQLFRQRHSQVSTVSSKGFLYKFQCGSGTYVSINQSICYIIALCFQKWNYQEVCAVVDEKEDISLWSYCR